MSVNPDLLRLRHINPRLLPRAKKYRDYFAETLPESRMLGVGDNDPTYPERDNPQRYMPRVGKRTWKLP